MDHQEEGYVPENVIKIQIESRRACLGAGDVIKIQTGSQSVWVRMNRVKPIHFYRVIPPENQSEVETQPAISDICHSISENKAPISDNGLL